MKESGYYPAGAEFDPDAPWNEPIIPKKKFEMDVEFIMQKKRVVVVTDDYIPETPIEDDGTVELMDTSETNWKVAYKENNYHTIPELLEILATYVKSHIEQLQQTRTTIRKRRQLQELLNECLGWEVYDSEYVESE